MHFQFCYVQKSTLNAVCTHLCPKETWHYCTIIDIISVSSLNIGTSKQASTGTDGTKDQPQLPVRETMCSQKDGDTAKRRWSTIRESRN